MENFRQPFFPSTTTTMTSIYEPMSSSPSTLASSSSLSYHYPAVQYLPPLNGGSQLYFQSSYPNYQKQASQPPFQYPRYPVLLPWPQPNPVSGDQEGIESKAARDEQRIARQRRLFLSRSAADSGSSSSSMQMDLCGADSDMQNTDLCTPDMKELRVLFKKQLKKSDVGSWGRIVVPKKEAEKYLPSLAEKQGIVMRIRDVHSGHVWGMKYKYWANNKSRMYVFESAGSFIRKNGLEVGDCISLYKDESKNFYFSIEKAGTRPSHVTESSYEQQHCATNSKDGNDDDNSSSINTQITNSDDINHKNNTNTYMNSSNNADIHSETDSNNTKLYTPYTFNEEDEWYLAALLEDESNKVVTLSADPAFSCGRLKEVNSSIDNVISTQLESSTQPAMAGIGASSSSSQSTVKMVEDHFDDCYKGLGTLPAVDRYEHDDFLL
ncbi:B3 domain-containing transcription factor LEC2-like [Rosa rugosa]|uniref:B3 domain-containing transcription factor LEC2-like n=1 Tax=Rosa rugosa TaxID=74645 RepID=UPI002B40723B|nr:B3 domain-containing transcription factor LEC2-like [Rosa rugosa]